MESQGTCAYCGSNSAFKCTACENVYYCSKEHQKKDWKKHVEVCKSFKLVENTTLGRHYIATRNIKVGEIVLKDEQPLIEGPMHNCAPLCLGCYTVLQKGRAVPCVKCGWPLCQNCKTHGSECNFTSSRRDQKVAISEFGQPHPSYQCISVIRALSLKETSPVSYEKLLSLESHCNQMNDNMCPMLGESSNIAGFIKRFFKSDDISSEEILKIIGILQVNGHEVPLTEPPYVAVYEKASMLEHNCRANCSKTFTDKGGLIIHAAVPIAKGEHISISYTDPVWGTSNRRHHLFETKFFSCTCDRCVDVTEFGTMFSALKCQQSNCTGYTLPTSFIDEEEKGYICNVCGEMMSYERVQETLVNIGLYLSNMKKHDVTACKEFLHRYKHVLHENHFYNIDVLIALAQLIGQQADGLASIDENLLVEKIQLCRKLENLLKLVMPAENRIRGLILFDLHAALTEFCRRQMKTQSSAMLLMEESKKCLVEACRLLHFEPKVLPEGKIYIHAERNLQELNKLSKQRGMESILSFT